MSVPNRQPEQPDALTAQPLLENALVDIDALLQPLKNDERAALAVYLQFAPSPYALNIGDV